ncbi:MAG: amidohydrolase family protein, partial [Coprobacillus sp.]
HISTLETVDLLRDGLKEGLKVSGEVSPHHLILTEENIKDCHPNYKMNPPLRSKEDHQALIQGLNDKTIKVIATDHAPHAREEKDRPIQDAPFGIIGIQHAFPLLNTYLIKKELVSLPVVLDALTIGPAEVLKLDATVEVGKTANLCVIDLDKSFVIKEEDIKSKSVNTPFIGVECHGQVIMNIVNGHIVELEEI